MLSEILDAADTRGETVLVNGYGSRSEEIARRLSG